MEGSIRGQLLSVLIDNGSTHNFIQEPVAHKLGIPLQELPEFRVFIGSGDYLICREVCRQVAITIQGAVITQDIFVLTMEGANVVLGVQWLETLGVVKTDYKNLSLEFNYGEKVVKLQGSSQLANSGVSNQGLRRMMAKKQIAYYFHV